MSALDDRRSPPPGVGDVATLLIATRAGLYAQGGDGAPHRVLDGDVAAVTVGAAAVWAVVDDTTLVRGDPERGFETVATHDRALRCVLASPHAATASLHERHGSRAATASLHERHGSRAATASLHERHGDDGVLAGTAGAGLVRLQGGGLQPVAGFDAVAGRDTWYTPWGDPPDTRSLAADADGALYANVHVGGIPRSVDGGVTWQPTIDVDADVHQVTTAGGLVLAAAARGLAVSPDDGTTWHWRTQGLHARYARAVAVAGDTVLLSVSRGPGGAESALYRGALSTQGPLSRCREGLPDRFAGNIDTGALVARGQAVAAADGSTVHVSTDAGLTWRVLTADLPPVRGLAPLPG